MKNYNAGFVEEIKRNMMNSSTAKSSIDPRMVLKNIFLAVEMIVKNPTLINPSKPSKSTKSSSHSRKLDYLMSILFLALGSVKKTNWVTLDAEKYALNILTKLLDLNLVNKLDLIV
ncbi:hypothetical protein HDV02_002330 [Globomyces sp. JEL0801]|nr:hypothetical protein HDV02_002308 [Globomyces sp. JEL0801]KAJ3000867.1 hypothetical protein HDV02_002330 [Globomyces sp. JEL0801]